MLAAVSSDELWVVISPMLATFVAIAGLWYSIAKDRRVAREIEDDRNERLDHAADAVLGIEADLSRGRMRQVGLVEKFAQYEQTQRQMAQAIDRVERTVTRIAGAQADQVHNLEQQAADNERRFARIEQELARVATEKGPKP